MATDAPKVRCSIDLSADGKRFGHLDIPNSRNDSGWGAGPVLVAAGDFLALIAIDR